MLSSVRANSTFSKCSHVLTQCLLLCLALLFVAGLAVAEESTTADSTCSHSGKVCSEDGTDGSKKVLCRDNLLTLPVRTVDEALLLQPGVVELRPASTASGFALSVRGGDATETGYFLNGVQVNNQQIGVSTFSISRHAAGMLRFQPGGFSADRGFIGASMVDVCAPRKEPKVSAMVEGVSDDLIDGGAGQNWYTGRLSGQIPGLENSSFYGLVERREFDDRNPSSMSLDILPDSPDYLPQNWLEGWSYHGGLNFGLGEIARLKFSVDGSQDEWSEYLHQYLFDLDHTPYYKTENLSVAGHLNLTPSDETRLCFGLTSFQTEYFRGDGLYRENLLDYYQPSGNLRFTYDALFWLDGHVWDDYLKKKSSYIGGDVHVSSYATPDFEISGDVDVRRHTVRSYNHLFPTRVLDGGGFLDVDRYGYDSVGNEIDGEDNGFNAVKHPLDLSASLQATYATRNVSLRFGGRLDYFRYDASWLRNPARPLDPDTLLDDEANELNDSDFDEEDAFLYFSPRLSLDLALTEEADLHVNIGRYVRRPDFDMLYVGESYLEHQVTTSSYYYALGNAALEPTKTMLFELGGTYEFCEDFLAGVTFFRKKVDDLPQVYSQAAYPKSYATYRDGFALEADGLEFMARGQLGDHVILNADYTVYPDEVEWAYPSATNVAWQSADETSYRVSPYFQRHKIVGQVCVTFDDNEGPKFGSVYPLENLDLKVLARVGSGLPYFTSEVYNEVTLGPFAPTPTAPRCFDYKGRTATIDLSLERRFKVGNLCVTPFLWVKNLLDRDNVYDVYQGTGEPNTTGWLETEAGIDFIDRLSDPIEPTGLNGEELYIIRENDPLHYGLPRQIYAGLRVEF